MIMKEALAEVIGFFHQWSVPLEVLSKQVSTVNNFSVTLRSYLLAELWEKIGVDGGERVGMSGNQLLRLRYDLKGKNSNSFKRKNFKLWDAQCCSNLYSNKYMYGLSSSEYCFSWCSTGYDTYGMDALNVSNPAFLSCVFYALLNTVSDFTECREGQLQLDFDEAIPLVFEDGFFDDADEVEDASAAFSIFAKLVLRTVQEGRVLSEAEVEDDEFLIESLISDELYCVGDYISFFTSFFSEVGIDYDSCSAPLRERVLSDVLPMYMAILLFGDVGFFWAVYDAVVEKFYSLKSVGFIGGWQAGFKEIEQACEILQKPFIGVGADGSSALSIQSVNSGGYHFYFSDEAGSVEESSVLFNPAYFCALRYVHDYMDDFLAGVGLDTFISDKNGSFYEIERFYEDCFGVYYTETVFFLCL